MTENKIPEIRKIEYWAPQLVYEFCVRNNMYTCGTNSDYTAMFTFIHQHEPTTENLYIVADNILKHSDDDATRNFLVSDIMTLLYKQTVTLDYIVED